MTTSANESASAASHASIPSVASRPVSGGGPAQTSEASVRGGGGEATANATATVTLTEEAQQQQHDEVLHLSLRARPSVRWCVNIYTIGFNSMFVDMRSGVHLYLK